METNKNSAWLYQTETKQKGKKKANTKKDMCFASSKFQSGWSNSWEINISQNVV